MFFPEVGYFVPLNILAVIYFVVKLSGVSRLVLGIIIIIGNIDALFTPDWFYLSTNSGG